MTLHRDIYWVGKQWAVTGFGVQACNQKQRGQFDIAAARLWEDGVQDAVRAQQWVNVDDFEKAVDAARKYYPEPPRKTSPPAEVAPAPPLILAAEGPAEPVTPKFDMQVERVRGELTPVWRIRTPVADPADNRVTK
jgi:hypothetical protein